MELGLVPCGYRSPKTMENMMKTHKIPASLIALSVCILAYFAVTTTAQETARDSAKTGDVGRFQVSAWSYSGSERSTSNHGAYIIDTATGKLWHSYTGHQPQEIGTVE